MHRWHVTGQSVRGIAHQRDGKPNQDALRWLPNEEPDRFAILALSDGHGSAKSFRSEIGACFAVDVVMHALNQLLEQHISGNLTPAAIQAIVEYTLSQSVTCHWSKQVGDHLAQNPFTKAELDQLKEKDGEAGLAAIRKNTSLAYGATALGLLVTEEFILYLQLGDGDILAVGEDGQVTRPIPKDERHFANQTTSLCSLDAWKDFRVCFQALPSFWPSLILLATDGYANSFREDEGFLQVGSDLEEMIQGQGWDQVTGNLEAWLMEASRDGSGDDITVGLVSFADLAQPRRHLLEFLPSTASRKSRED